MLTNRRCCCGGENPCTFPCAGCATGLPISFQVTDCNGTWTEIKVADDFWEARCIGPLSGSAIETVFVQPREYLIRVICTGTGLRIEREWHGEITFEGCNASAVVPDYDAVGACYGQVSVDLDYPDSCESFAISGEFDDSAFNPSLPQGPFTDQAIAASADAIGGGSCCQTFQVTGCNGVGLGYARVRVLTGPGGTLLGEAVMNADGTTALSWFGTCNVYVEVEYSPEFTTSGESLSLTAAGTTNLDGLTVASGYHCFPNCAIPLPDTLHATHPALGALTFTYSSGFWVSTKVYSYPGFPDTGCPSSTVTVTSKLNASTGAYTESWKTDDDGCPTNSGSNTYTVTWDNGPRACPPGPSLTYSRLADGAEEQNLYQDFGFDALSLSLTA